MVPVGYLRGAAGTFRWHLVNRRMRLKATNATFETGLALQGLGLGAGLQLVGLGQLPVGCAIVSQVPVTSWRWRLEYNATRP